MSIKSLFNNKTTTVQSANSGSTDVESKDFILTRAQRDETFLPFVDFSSASNFAKFGSAEEYYKNSIERIYNEYPYDGSEKEKLKFELSSSYLDKYIFDERYPKTNGYINFTGPAGGGSKTSGYGTNSTPQYIYMRGGIHVADGMTTNPLYKTFDKSVVYDDTKKRISSLKMDIPNGITTEFWLKKEAFNNTRTEKEVILDLWNGELSSSANYGRFTLALSGTTAGTDTFILTMQSGTTGFFEQSIGTTTVTTSSLTDWHHYAFSFISASTGVTSRIYIDGDLNESKSLGSTGVNEIGGLVNGYIGALQTAPSGNVFHGVNLVAGGTLSASLDDFRFWKTRRTSKQIYNNWYRHVGGGTNTDDANTDLGVYYKFNEGIVGNTSTDSVVLDYSGRLVNGAWTGYASGMRSTNSAFVESGLLTSEPKDPIIYSSHSEVSSLKTSLMNSGKLHDNQNPALLYYKVPQWIRDEDALTGDSTKQLYQIIASYFDTLHAQITALPYLKNKVYPSSSYKALPFADRLLEDKGLVVSNLFADSNVLEAFGDRDLNKVQYEKKVTDIKNQIYTNIYNNLESIYKHKGTEGSIRNMLRCFGIDDEIVKLNIYTDHGTHYFSDSFKHTSLNKKYIDFNKKANLGASIFQTSSVNHSLTYISGSGAEKLEQYNALSSEVSILVPKKLGFFDKGYFPNTFQSASVFGMHGAATDSADYTWGVSETTTTPQTASIQFTMVSTGSLQHQAVLQLTGGSDNALVVYADPNQALATSPSTIDHIIYTGSVGMALLGNTAAAARFRNLSYSGIDTVDGLFSVSYWFNTTTSDDNSIYTYLKLQNGSTDIISINPHTTGGDVDVTISSTTPASETETFSSLHSGIDSWKHYVFAFDLTSIASGGATVTAYRNSSQIATKTFSTLSATANALNRILISLGEGAAIQDVVVWNKTLSPADVLKLYGNGQWVNPTTVSSSQINDWYKFGYEGDFAGAADGDALTDFGSQPFLSSSYPPSSNRDLQIVTTTEAGRIEFHTGSNPFGEARTDTQIRNELTAALNTVFSANFGNTTYSGGDGTLATFTLKSGSAGPKTVNGSVVSSSFAISATNNGATLSSTSYDDLANFQVYLVRDELESSSGKFLLKDYAGNFTLESPVYKEVYSNEPWNISVRVKPEDYPIAGNVVTSSNRDYTLEFYGVNHAFDTIKNEFFLTQSLNYETGSAYLSNAKRFYVGAHRTNFTGSVLEQTDIKAGRFNLWYDYVGNDEVKLHNRDVSSKGNKRTARPSTMFSKDLEGYEIPSYELLAADWDFELVSTSDNSGEFIVVDASSGSTDSRYGWIDNIVRREHRAKGFGFPTSTAIAANEIVYSSKKELPEIGYSADGVTIKGEREEYFIEDEDVSDNFYALEKSMYQTISEEMMRTLSTAQEMSNLMGEAVERYRLEYKKLNHVRRMFFEDVEEDPDFDKFTEYFKWIDSSVSYMISQMFPLSVRFSKGISDVVESHLFERNKYQNKFPLITTHTATEGHASGIGQSKYRWEFGHAPIEVGAGDNDNCLWQKERAERTDIADRETLRQIIGNRNNAEGTTVSGSSGTYTTSKYGIRNFSKPVDMTTDISQTIHAGINYNLQKNRDYIWSATHRGSELTSLGIPKNVLIVGAGTGQGIELPSNTCNDAEVPNKKKKYNTTVYVGKFAAGGAGGAFSEINDSASYSYAIKGAHNLPFDIFSGSIGAYNTAFSNGYRSDAYVTNMHSDTTDFSNDIPLQGPFTKQWVGGHQSRHIELNRFDTTLRDDDSGTAPPNNLDNKYTRPEGWLLKVVESVGTGSDGAFGIVDPQYGVTKATNTYPDAAKKAATLYRDGRAKRAVNIANIQTTTSSANYGNYREKYEVISAMGKHKNNLFFRKNVDTHTFIPTSIGNILPETTNYQTLVGVSAHTTGNLGNVFGVGESNVVNAVLATPHSAVPAEFIFSVDEKSNLSTGDFLTITASAKNYMVQTADPHVAPTQIGTADLLLYTGSYGKAFKATGTSDAEASRKSGAYSGLGTRVFSLSFWLSGSDGNSNTLIDFYEGASRRHEVDFDNDIKVRYENNASSADDAKFTTNITNDTGWNHYVIHFDVNDLDTGVPRLWKNGVELSTDPAYSAYSPVGGSTPSIDGIEIQLDDQMALQDIVIWTDLLLTQEHIDELYAKGNWSNPSLHSQQSKINNWYKFGYEDYWDSLGYTTGSALNSLGSANYTISSSYGTGTGNHLTITSTHDEDFTFITGSNPFGPAKTDAEIFNEISSSIVEFFPQYTITKNAAGATMDYTGSYNPGSYDLVNLTEDGNDYVIKSQTSGRNAYKETSYFNTTTKATGSATKTIISSRFSAPGSIDTMTYGFLDAYSQEYSVYNSLNYRNLFLRGIAVRISASSDGSEFYNFGGSGENETIRMDNHLAQRDSHKALLSRHCGKYGVDTRNTSYSTITNSSISEANFQIAVNKPSFHKQQRNENKRPLSGSSTTEAPVFITRHDNAYVNSAIPRSDFQYKWVTSSLGSNYSITSGKQRMYGYAHPTGILSSSVAIDGDSGFVPAITFPTASEIFGV